MAVANGVFWVQLVNVHVHQDSSSGVAITYSGVEAKKKKFLKM